MPRPKLHRKCSHKDCTRPHLAIGFCCMHWWRNKHGKDMDAPYTPKIGNMVKWLEANVAYPHNECLEWPFGYRDNGYGVVHYRGASMAANRAMCFIAHGEPPSPEKKYSAHSCHNRRCVNPRHLRWATAKENVQDTMDRLKTPKAITSQIDC